eukprot:TRINITY_DN1933_c0_g1_i1.p1 TRINITY_DN1933_c0_g1~~TRINITY_DN1933_c0_g1_i1.p1  ORF type:complete len:572 (-),score=276.31 TRINITY_DN1933_c0_g1_i1:76-1743(-)
MAKNNCLKFLNFFSFMLIFILFYSQFLTFQTSLLNNNNDDNNDNNSNCRFAKLYSVEDLLYNQTSLNKFKADVFYWEGNFAKNGVGVNFKTGMTYDGHGINYYTGQPEPGYLHYWTAASKESIHLMLLANAVVGNQNALNFVCNNCTSQQEQLDTAITLLENKMTTYLNFNKKYPGFGGFIPWLYVNDSGMIPADGWSNQVPSLDNGEWIWGLKAIVIALNSIGYKDLATSYESYFNLLAENALTVFYDGNGNIRAVSQIKDNQAQPTTQNYYTTSPCYDPCYLGEMFVFFADLYGNWGSNKDERELLWINKRAKLQSVEFEIDLNYWPKELKKPIEKEIKTITVQRGWWFSAHEQWKYLELPYLDIEINKRIFINGEKARTWNSAMNKYAGLFASVTDVSTKPSLNVQYKSDLGIPSIAFQSVSQFTTVTPYATFPLWLTSNEPIAAVWYHLMLNGPSMQGPLGSTESCNVTGTAISPVVTWDSKISTLAAMIGGISHFTRFALQLDGQYLRFCQIVEREWTLAFPYLNGELAPFLLPTIQIQNNLQDFIDCSI